MYRMDNDPRCPKPTISLAPQVRLLLFLLQCSRPLRVAASWQKSDSVQFRSEDIRISLNNPCQGVSKTGHFVLWVRRSYRGTRR